MPEKLKSIKTRFFRTFYAHLRTWYVNPIKPERLEAKTYTKTFRLAPFFEAWWDEYVKHPAAPITPEQYKAVAAMRACRTEALGVDHYVCRECGEISHIYHSCKNRFCPTCSWSDTLKWADKMKEQLLDIPHRHTVFTLPHKLNKLISDNKNILLGILFKSASYAIKEWMSFKYKLTPGIISVLHTAGETKEQHFHIHMILSWGGLNHNFGVEEIKNQYINYEFIQKKFRCKFEDMLIEHFDANALIHNFSDRIHLLRFIKEINLKNWRIHFEDAIKMPAQVIRYVGRYSKRACLSEYKITNIKDEFISFKYKDNKSKDFYGKPIEKELTLHYRDFFPRLLQHVPLPYFRLVRYYGAYAARTKALINKNYREILSGSKEEPVCEEEMYDKPDNPKMCKNCNVEKLYMYTSFKTKTGERVHMSRYIPLRRRNKLKNMAA